MNTNNASQWVEAIESIYKLQVLVDNGMAKIKERKEEISGQLYSLAKACKTVDEFDQRCTYAEGQFKANHKKGTKLPAHWVQVKSNIKAAMRKGISLEDHDTESSMRAELNKRRKEEKAEKEQGSSEKVEVTPLDLQVGTIRAMLDEMPEQDALDMCEHFISLIRAANNAPVYDGEVVQPAALRVAN